MPLYEYRCEACGQSEELLERISAPEVHGCQACGLAEGMKRQISVAAFALAGAGWYKGSATEPKAATEAAPTAPADPPKSSHGCGSGGCGCPLAG